MKSIFKWLGLLLAIIFAALLLYQNYQVLLEQQTLYLFSEEIFGFNFGAITLPLLLYFVFCIIAGAAFMIVPSVGLWVRTIRLQKRLKIAEEQLLDEEGLPTGANPSGDLAYHIEEDELEE